jgi:chromosomal replication initiation ATPase DnaA
MKSQSKRTPFKRVKMEMMTRQICDYLNISIFDVKSKTRKRPVVNARMISMYLGYQKQVGTKEDIGKFFGGRDHSTVIHAIETIENEIEMYSDFKKSINEIKKILSGEKDLGYTFIIPNNSPEVNKNLEDYQEVKSSL